MSPVNFRMSFEYSASYVHWSVKLLEVENITYNVEKVLIVLSHDSCCFQKDCDTSTVTGSLEDVELVARGEV